MTAESLLLKVYLIKDQCINQVATGIFLSQLVTIKDISRSSIPGSWLALAHLTIKFHKVFLA